MRPPLRPLARPFALFLGLVGILACSGPPPRHLLGAYRFPDGDIVSVRPSLDDTLRYRLYRSGASGRLYAGSGTLYTSGPGFSGREPVELTIDFHLDAAGKARSLTWTPQDAPARQAQRIGGERRVAFPSDEIQLAGRLHVPEGGGPFPAVVLVHGSGKTPGSDWQYNGDFLVPHGFVVLVYDKRGTGDSGGAFTFDFDQLARDVVAAVAFLRTLPEVDGSRIGLSGYSQGGWVAPLAATRTPVSFVLVSYGLAISPAEEARLEMMHLVEAEEVTASERAAADALIRAAIHVVASGFGDGWAEFKALKQEHRDAPWRQRLDGTPVDRLGRYPAWLIRIFGRGQLPRGLPWDHDPVPVLEDVDVPMTWFLAGEDLSAPNGSTIRILESLGTPERPCEVRLYPDADHGILRFETSEEGRVYTGYAPRYFRDEVDAARKWNEAGRRAR